MGKSISPRARLRRDNLRVLKSVKERINWLTGQWDVRGTVYFERSPQTEQWVRAPEGQRQRRAEEYPENQVEAWNALAEQCKAAIAELESLREFAGKMAFGLKNGGEL